MRKVFFISASLVSCLTVFSQEPAEYNDSAICLKVQGVLENAFEKSDDPCLVVVFKGNEVVDTVTLTRHRKKLTYYFDKNAYYSLRILKCGFVPLLLDVDTRIPEGKNVLYQFEFETRLISEKRARTFDKQLLNRPYAIIRFDPRKKAFDYDEEYTRSLKTGMVLNSRKWL